MVVKIKKLVDTAILPKYSKPGDAGLDLTATSKEFDEFGNVSFGTGLAVQIPEGHVGLIFPRSSVAKSYLTLANSVGVIDSGFRGEVTFKFKPTLYFKEEKDKDPLLNYYEVGDRVGQLIIIPYPQIEFEEVEELEQTERGSGSYGSTGI